MENPMPITHVFFDLYGTLVDSAQMPPCYARNLGRVMSARYGGTPEAWANANLRILADWDSYFADLDLNADDGIDQMWEGEFRVTRALFRLTGTPEPAKDELWTLVRELPERATETCDTLYPDARPAIEALRAAGYLLGTASNALSAQVRGTLRGGGVLDAFTVPLFGSDLAESFGKDVRYFRALLAAVGVEAAQCALVDDSVYAILGARAVGMYTIQVCRPPIEPRASQSPAHRVLRGGLAGIGEGF
jgi:FMN phosphatase YigB (HAD superfamily)